MGSLNHRPVRRASPFCQPGEQLLCLTRCDSIATALNLFATMDLVGFFAKPLAEKEFPIVGLVQLNLDKYFPVLNVVILKQISAINTVAAQNFLDCFMAEYTEGSLLHNI